MNYLTMRQRTPPPVDRTVLRRGQSTGGRDVPDGPRTLAPGIVDDLSRYPGASFDGQIMRDRSPYYEQPRYSTPGNSWVNWTAAGPTRPELHMRNTGWRREEGTGASRFPTVPTPTGGMHTETPTAVTRTFPRYVDTPQMVPGRIDRLAPGQYAGQTYSQTTRIQGR